MKILVIAFLIFGLADTVLAAESNNESRFHLLSSKCKAEDSEKMESTPQSPPLNVDDPATPGCNHWEINVLAGVETTRQQTSRELPLLDVNYGIGDNLQLKYELPYVINESNGSHASAVGESTFGIKDMFFDDDRHGLALAVYPQLSFSQADSAAARKGLTSPGNLFMLPLLMTLKLGETSLGEVNLSANLGYNISTKPDIANFISASVGLGTPISSRVSIMGELSTEQAVARVTEDIRAQNLKANLGVLAALTRSVMMFGSVGHSLMASDDVGHTYALVGFRFLIGGSSNDYQLANPIAAN